MQKTEFLKALSDMWKDFDSRVLRYKVCSVLKSILSSSDQCYPHVSTLCEHHFVMYHFIEATETCICQINLIHLPRSHNVWLLLLSACGTPCMDSWK